VALLVMLQQGSSHQSAASALVDRGIELLRLLLRFKELQVPLSWERGQTVSLFLLIFVASCCGRIGSFIAESHCC
jgi:hypothetical protein